MRLLAIETSGPGVSVALVEGDTPLSRADLLTRAATSECVIQLVDQVVKGPAIPGETVDAIAVCRGPGSFTGIRIGLATARSLGLGWSRPVTTVTAFEAGAAGLATYPGGLVVLLDARRGQIYAQCFGPPAGGARAAGDWRVTDPGDLGRLPWPSAAGPSGAGPSAADPSAAEPSVTGESGAGQRTPGPLAVVGTAVARYAEAVRAAFPGAWITDMTAPDAVSVARAVRLGCGCSELSPLYIRPPDARLPRPSAGSPVDHAV